MYYNWEFVEVEPNEVTIEQFRIVCGCAGVVAGCFRPIDCSAANAESANYLQRKRKNLTVCRMSDDDEAVIKYATRGAIVHTLCTQ